MQVDNWPVSKIIPYARNARVISPQAIDKVASSLKEFGFRQPIVVDSEGVIIAGHTRFKAAQKLGLNEVPVHVATGLNAAQVKSYRLMDNRSHEESEWENDLLISELEELSGEDWDLALTGFDDDELSRLLAEGNEGNTDPDEVPEAPAEPISVLGDVWILGNHRLMCGDSTSIDAVEKLMDGQKADMCFTDPPYGMSYGGGRRAGKKPSNRAKFGTRENFGVIENDDLRGEDLTKLVCEALGSAKLNAKAGSAFYICFPWRTYSEFEAGLVECGLEPNACIVWDKKYIGLGNANYRPQHEFIFYIKGGAWHGDKAQSDIWSMSRDNGKDYVHPTQKPVELIERAINNSSKAGDTVIDVFGGSGSTLIASERLGRHAHLMELDPKYVDVIVQRWQNFTGLEAHHVETGESFNSALANRGNPDLQVPPEGKPPAAKHTKRKAA